MSYKKKIIIALVAALVTASAGGGFWWWLESRQEAARIAEASRAVADIHDAIGTVNGRLADSLYENMSEDGVSIPNVNPYRNANPFADMRTNPFR